MIAEAPVERPAHWHPAATSHDNNEQLKSLFWFHRQIDAGMLQEYDGRYIAILGEQVVDSDADPKVLCKRVDAKYGLEANVLVKGLVPVPNWK